MSIERDFDVPLIAGLALREKQIQQNYRPVIGVHKWFARRPGTLFRGLLIAEFGTGPLQDTFFAGNDLLGRRVADPFMGGGTPLIEANRLGCDVQGFDLNPMASWIVREEIDHLDLAAYGRAAGSLVDTLRGEIGRYYRTFCPRYGDAEVPVKSFLWVKTLDCAGCGESIDLFPGYLLAANRRHPTNVLVCAACGDLNEAADRDDPGECSACGRALRLTGPARRGRCDCPRCGHPNPIRASPAAPCGIACSPSNTTITGGRESTGGASSSDPTRMTSRARTRPANTGGGYRRASSPTTRSRRATRPAACTAGDTPATATCSTGASFLVWS